ARENDSRETSAATDIDDHPGAGKSRHDGEAVDDVLLQEDASVALAREPESAVPHVEDREERSHAGRRRRVELDAEIRSGGREAATLAGRHPGAAGRRTGRQSAGRPDRDIPRSAGRMRTFR